MTRTSIGSTVRRVLWTILRAGITLGAIGFVLTQITWKDRLIIDEWPVYGWLEEQGGDRFLHTTEGKILPIPQDADNPGASRRFVPGIVTIFGRIKVPYVVVACILYTAVIFLGALRWKWLLESHDLHPGYFETLRLTWMGFLASNVLPGATGGDVFKAVCISRRSPGKRTSAVMTVILDRIVGLVALVLVGSIAVLLKSGRSGMTQASYVVLGLLGGAVVAGMIFFSARARRVLRVDQILTLLPFGGVLKRIDESLYHYRDHKGQLAWTVLLSVFIHLWGLGNIYLLGLSLSMSVPILDYYAYLPVIFTAGAVFPSIAGLGVLEGLFQQFFSAAGAPAASAVALCLLYRVMQLVSSLPGALPLYQEFSVAKPKDVSSIADEMEAADGSREPIDQT